MEGDGFTTPPGSPRLFMTAAALAPPNAPHILRRSRPIVGRAVYDIYEALRRDMPRNTVTLQNALLRFPVTSLRGFVQMGRMTNDEELERVANLVLADLVLDELQDVDDEETQALVEAAVGFWLDYCSQEVQFRFYAQNTDFVRGFNETQRALEYDIDTELLVHLGNPVEIYFGVPDLDMTDANIFTDTDIMMTGRDLPACRYPPPLTDSGSDENTGLVRATPDASSSEDESGP